MHPISTQSIRTLIGAVALVCAAGTAQASTVVFETTGFFAGTAPGFANPSFTITAGGNYLATLSDLSFGPLGFSALLMSVSSSTNILADTSSPGSFSFTASPGNYFANVIGLPTGLGGIFGIQISQVPIPAAAYLLGSGLIGLLSIARRREAD
jgi:hypothetical protein